MREHRRDLSTILTSEGADVPHHTQTALVVQCTQCREWLSISDFYAEKRVPSGRKSCCKPCHRANVKRRQQDPAAKANRDAYQAAYRARNREDARQRTRAYVAANPERARAANARCRVRPENREKAREAAREFRLANPDRRSEYERRRRASKKSTTIGFIEPVDLVAKMAYWGNRCWMCKSTDEIQIDHVKPLSKGGAHVLANLRPACRPCNLAKSDRWPLDT